MCDFLTVKDVAKILKISYDSALAFIKFSGIDYWQIGRQYRVPKDAFDTLIKRKGQWLVVLEE